jgi:CheY-like chemotaxis protein
MEQDKAAATRPVILLVEDNKILLKTYEQMFASVKELRGYRLAAFETAWGAMEWLNALEPGDAPAVILLDWVMEGMTGMDMLVAIRKDPGPRGQRLHRQAHQYQDPGPEAPARHRSARGGRGYRRDPGRGRSRGDLRSAGASSLKRLRASTIRPANPRGCKSLLPPIGNAAPAPAGTTRPAAGARGHP